MNKEPLALYIFRLFINTFLLLIIAMLYWSSILVESNIHSLRAELGEMKQELTRIQKATDKISTDLLNSAHNQSKSTIPEVEVSVKAGSHIDPTLPNLLHDDPFYTTTLPRLLGPTFRPLGTFHNDVLGKPDSLHPFSNWAQVSAWQSLCLVSVARQQFGIYEMLCPDMALKMEERINPDTNKKEFWIHLRDGVFWQPLRRAFFEEQIQLAPHFFAKHPVTAHDFKLFFDAVMNPFIQDSGAIAARIQFSDVESFEVVDDLTFIVRWKYEVVKEPDGRATQKMKYVVKQLTGGLRPLASYVYKYFSDGSKIIEEDSDPSTYRTSSVWAQNFSQHWAKNIIVGCGPWLFDGMTERQINFKRNADHFNHLDALAEAYETQIKETPEALWQSFKANLSDTYLIRPDQLLDLTAFMKTPQYELQAQSGAAIHRLEYPTRSFVYIGWNEANPLFKNKKVRQALTMAIDRQRIIRQNLNGLGIEINGPFYRYSPAYDSSIPVWPFAPQQAKLLLAQEGWLDSDGDGILDKEIDGKKVPFSFSLTYYVKNPTSKANSEYVATALKEIGINCNLNGVDVADLSAVFQDKNFDALYLAWALSTPPEDPKQIWYSTGAKEAGSSNAIGFANKEVDAIIDSLTYEENHEKRIELYHRFDAIIHDEAPYTFLYTPLNILLYRDYLQNVFIPAERQDLVPGANVTEPDSAIFWLKPL